MGTLAYSLRDFLRLSAYLLSHPQLRILGLNALEHQNSGYSAPPIFEAVIELRLDPHLSDSQIRKLAKMMAREYPNVRDETEVEFKIDLIGEEPKPSVVSKSPSLRLSSDNEVNSVTVKKDRIFLSRLAPYCGWGEFFDRFSFVLKSISKEYKSRNVKRLGLRYRNRIDIPIDEAVPVLHYEDYLSAHITLPEVLDPLGFYTWRIDKPFEKLGLRAMVASETVPPEIPKTGAFLLDIDVYFSPNISFGKVDFSERLLEMRNLKNRIFESVITDKARANFH